MDMLYGGEEILLGSSRTMAMSMVLLRKRRRTLHVSAANALMELSLSVNMFSSGTTFNESNTPRLLAEINR